MNETLKNLLLSATLIALPAAGFTLAETLILSKTPAAAATAASSLGDLSAFSAIASDTQKIAATGNFAAAEKRVTDFETLWDDSEPALRKADPNAWGVVDGAADEAISSLRARTPDKAKIDAALTGLLASLQNPAASADSGGAAQMIAGIAVTDGNGHPLPCEGLAGQVKTAFTSITPTQAMLDLQAKALERCNADDDAHSDAFSAQALALVKG